jgi:hypothetical protein
MPPVKLLRVTDIMTVRPPFLQHLQRSTPEAPGLRLQAKPRIDQTTLRGEHVTGPCAEGRRRARGPKDTDGHKNDHLS